MFAIPERLDYGLPPRWRPWRRRRFLRRDAEAAEEFKAAILSAASRPIDP